MTYSVSVFFAEGLIRGNKEYPEGVVDSFRAEMNFRSSVILSYD
jgi:hypothetical protein